MATTFEIMAALAKAEMIDGQIMDKHNTEKLRRQNERLRAKVEVLEMEVRHLQRELTGE